jgi:hypothetical protein
MITTESPVIPGFKIYGGTSASSAEDANHTVFYANCGTYKPNDNRFGLYLFKIGNGKIENIPLNPFPESRGVLVADVWGLNLTTTMGGSGGKFMRYKVSDYGCPRAAVRSSLAWRPTMRRGRRSPRWNGDWRSWKPGPPA